MTPSAMSMKELDLIAPSSGVVRDQDRQVIEVERQALRTFAVVRCVGRSDLVQNQRAAVFSDLDRIESEDPEETQFRVDTSPHGIETRFVLEAPIHRTPLPVSNTSLTVGHEVLVDDLRLGEIDRVYRQVEGLLAAHGPAAVPLIRIVGALLLRKQ